MKHDEKKIKEIMEENFFNGTDADGFAVMKQYAEHMVQQVLSNLRVDGRDIRRGNLFENEVFRDGYIRANKDIIKAITQE